MGLYIYLHFSFFVLSSTEAFLLADILYKCSCQLSVISLKSGVNCAFE
jgi:hypothetical protein